MNPIRKAVIGGTLVIATMGGGAVGAALMSGTAGAATNPTSTMVAASTSSTAAAKDANQSGPHQANGITETPLTGDTLAKAEAAAKAAVPGGTIERAETDAEGAKYEVHVTKADGSDVTVKLDASFNVTGTVNGHG